MLRSLSRVTKTKASYRLEISPTSLNGVPPELRGTEVVVVLSRGEKASKTIASAPQLLGIAGPSSDLDGCLTLDVTLFRDPKGVAQPKLYDARDVDRRLGDRS